MLFPSVFSLLCPVVFLASLDGAGWRRVSLDLVGGGRGGSGSLGGAEGVRVGCVSLRVDGGGLWGRVDCESLEVAEGVGVSLGGLWGCWEGTRSGAGGRD